MKIKVLKHTAVSKDGTRSTYFEFVDENGKLVKGAFNVIDGRPYDVLAGEYVD